jgi:hypothetical protein
VAVWLKPSISPLSRRSFAIISFSLPLSKLSYPWFLNISFWDLKRRGAVRRCLLSRCVLSFRSTLAPQVSIFGLAPSNKYWCRAWPLVCPGKDREGMLSGSTSRMSGPPVLPKSATCRPAGSLFFSVETVASGNHCPRHTSYGMPVGRARGPCQMLGVEKCKNCKRVRRGI